MCERSRDLRAFVVAHPVSAAYALAFLGSMLDLVSTAYAVSHPGIVEANPVVAYGITVGWHYVVFQKVVLLAMSGMAAHIVVKLVNHNWHRAWVIATRSALALPAVAYFAISISNFRLGLLAAGAL